MDTEEQELLIRGFSDNEIKEEFDEDASTWGTRGNKGFGSTH